MNKEDIEYYINFYTNKYLNNNNYPAKMYIYISYFDMNLIKYYFKYNDIVFCNDLTLKSGFMKFSICYPDEHCDHFTVEILTENERLIKEILE